MDDAGLTTLLAGLVPALLRELRPSADVPRRPRPAVTAPPGQPLAAVWRAPAGQRAAGVVTTTAIPGARSGFRARPAWIYLPPAYQSTPRPLLPVVVLVAGQPGTPRDWFDGGQLNQILDRYAAAHDGLAPVVVVPDALGSQLANPLCVDSPAGNAFTYLAQDVPEWIDRTLQADPDRTHWAVGGVSAGATCALQLAVGAPITFPTALVLSGQRTPTLGSRARTVREHFGGGSAGLPSWEPAGRAGPRALPRQRRSRGGRRPGHAVRTPGRRAGQRDALGRHDRAACHCTRR